MCSHSEVLAAPQNALRPATFHKEAPHEPTDAGECMPHMHMPLVTHECDCVIGGTSVWCCVTAYVSLQLFVPVLLQYDITWNTCIWAWYRAAPPGDGGLSHHDYHRLTSCSPLL